MRVWLVMLAALICIQLSAFAQELVPEDEPAEPPVPQEKETPEEPPAPQEKPAAEEKVVKKPAAPEATAQLAPDLRAKIDALVKQLSADEWEKREEATKKLADQAKMSREDAQKLADELMQVGEERWSDMEKAVTEMTRKGLDSLDLPRQSELADLKKKIEKLEKRLAAIEAQGAGAEK